MSQSTETNDGASTSSDTLRCAVCGTRRSDEGAQLAARLERLAVRDAEWFAPRDLHDLGAAVAAGRFDFVLFGSAEQLMQGVFDGDIDLDAWRSHPVRLEFLHRGETAADALLIDAGDGFRDALCAMQRSWTRWSEQQARRRRVSGVILSAVAIAGAMLVMWMAR